MATAIFEVAASASGGEAIAICMMQLYEMNRKTSVLLDTALSYGVKKCMVLFLILRICCFRLRSANSDAQTTHKDKSKVLRETNITTAILSHFASIWGANYLVEVLGPVIRDIVNKKNCFEVTS